MPRSSGIPNLVLKHNSNLKFFLYPGNLYKSQHQELRNFFYCSAVLFYIFVVNLIISISSLWLAPPPKFLSLLLLFRVLSVDQHYQFSPGSLLETLGPTPDLLNENWHLSLRNIFVYHGC